MWQYIFLGAIITALVAMIMRLIKLRKFVIDIGEANLPANSLLEDDILKHLELQSKVKNDMLDNDYIQDEIGNVDTLVSVYNLALGLYYLSVVQQEGLSDITEDAVSQFIREGYEAYGSAIVKEREPDENIN